MAQMKAAMSPVFDRDRLLVCVKDEELSLHAHDGGGLAPRFEWCTLHGSNGKRGASVTICGTPVSVICRDGSVVQSLLVSCHGVSTRTLLFGCGSCGYVEYLEGAEAGTAYVSLGCPGCGAELSWVWAQRCLNGHTWGQCEVCKRLDQRC